MNKQDIISNINTKIDDGGLSTAEEVRGVLSVDDNSLLEAVYGDAVLDSNILQTYTVKNSNFNYKITVFKNGNHTTMSGDFTALTNNMALSEILEISDPNIKGSSKTSVCINQFGDFNGVLVSLDASSNCYLKNTRSILAGQIFSFSITYNSLN